MTKAVYRKRLERAFLNGQISVTEFDKGLAIADVVCDDGQFRDRRFDDCYAEIEYADMDSREAVEGCWFDDMNYLRHFER